MKLIKNSKISAILILALLLASTFFVILPLQQVKAQKIVTGDSESLPSNVTPDHTIATKAYLSFRPNPVGINQVVLVNMWVNPSTTSGRRLMDLSVIITAPDGTKDVKTVDSYYADSTAWFEYIVDQIGTWKLKFDFPGGYFPAGLVWDYRTSSYLNYTESIYYQPASSPEMTLTVQQDQIMSWPPAPLPTDYWTRPIEPQNREWWTILGNVPWYGPGGGPAWDQQYPDTNPYWNAQESFTPWVQGPNSAHIVWKQLGADAGIIGSEEGIASWPFNFSGSYYNPPSVIFQGRIYQTVTKPGTINPMGQSYWQCIDIRTGKLLWERALFTGESEPNIIGYETNAGSVPGAQEKAGAPTLVSISNGFLRKYTPFNGAMILNISIAPLTGNGGTYYMDNYVLGIQNLGTSSKPNYRLINWTTAGTDTNFTNRIASNTTYTRGSLPTLIDWNIGRGAVVSNIDVDGAYVGTSIQGFNALTGELTFNVTLNEPTFSGSAAIADHGKVAVLSANGYYVAYDLMTGNLAWKGEQFLEPWGTFAGYNVASAYGLLFRGTYAAFYAINWENGKIVWHFTAPAIYPYDSEVTGENGTTVNPFRSAAWVADGKVYVNNQRQGSQNPLPRGWYTFCLNATTGDLIWKAPIAGSVYNVPTNLIQISDGYMVTGGVDGYTYAFGKGKSETTLSVPQTAITIGQNAIISGTVLDQSPAQPGTPAVSDASMSTWMGYLHLQYPIDGMYHNESVTGVPVSIDSIDPNGNAVHIADVTSDMSGSFAYTWTPKISGDYKITATFTGTNSYGSSWAETHANVVSATTSPTPPTTISIGQTSTDSLMTTLIAGIIAIIIAIAVVGLLLLKKK
jgi:hypothetical protein